MKYTAAYSSAIKLEALLKRRRTTLAAWATECGITSYAGLAERCSRMGVVPPSEEAFERAVPIASASSPAEGIVVVEVGTELGTEQPTVAARAPKKKRGAQGG